MKLAVRDWKVIGESVALGTVPLAAWLITGKITSGTVPWGSAVFALPISAAMILGRRERRRRR